MANDQEMAVGGPKTRSVRIGESAHVALLAVQQLYGGLLEEAWRESALLRDQLAYAGKRMAEGAEEQHKREAAHEEVRASMTREIVDLRAKVETLTRQLAAAETRSAVEFDYVIPNDKADAKKWNVAEDF
jgi:hypothetical protein